jgi:hypothetical protein
MISEMITRKTTKPSELKPPSPVESRSPMSPKSPDPDDPLEPLPLLHDPDELELRELLLLLLLPRELLEPPLKELPPPGRIAALAVVTIETSARTTAKRRARLMRRARRAAR